MVLIFVLIAVAIFSAYEGIKNFCPAQKPLNAAGSTSIGIHRCFLKPY